MRWYWISVCAHLNANWMLEQNEWNDVKSSQPVEMYSRVAIWIDSQTLDTIYTSLCIISSLNVEYLFSI